MTMSRDEVTALGLRYTKWGVKDRYHLLFDLAHRAPAGCIVEAGVAMGGSAVMLAGSALCSVGTGAPLRELYLYDSFEGLPDPGPEDGAKAVGMKGRCAAPEESVRRALTELGYPDEHTHIVAGWFDQTIPATERSIPPIAVLHIDGDWYASCKICLEYLVPKLVHGAVVIMDDYGHWDGCRRAVDEFFLARCWDPKVIQRMAGSPQAWWVR